ncbi:MAG: protein kinase [Polyangiales bacterium]
MTQNQLTASPASDDNQLGKYRLVAVLGQGGMGTVHLALSSGLGNFRKLLVVKELRRDVPWRESALAMFMDEAHLAARLDHPNVLQTFEAGEDQGRYFLAMEYLDGQPFSALRDRARESDPKGLPLPLQIYVLCEVLQGLAYAHELRDYDGSRLHVVHRDISPQNVFVTYHGQIKIVDFGVAKANNARNLTSPGVFKGKFAYAAPEQLLGRPVDGRCDVFSVGVMLWEAIAGRRFSDPTPTPSSFRARANGHEPNIRDAVSGVDPRLAEICDRALATDPDDRFASADALRLQLQDYLVSSGERVESVQLAAVMRELFERERAERLQVIERTMSHVSSSAVQAVPIAPTPFRRDQQETRPERVSAIEAHEAALRASTASGSVSRSLTGVTTRPPRLRWRGAVGLAGLAIAVFAGTFLVGRSYSVPAAVRPGATRDMTQQATVAAPPPIAAPEPPPADPSATAAAREPEAPPAGHASTEAARKPAPAVAARTSAKPKHARVSAAPPKPPAARESAAAENTAEAPARVDTPSTPSTPRAQTKPAASEATPAEETGMGSNLRALRRGPNRRLDVEDPFR